MIQLKVLKILSKTPLTKENKCQMLTQAINFCKFIFCFLREWLPSENLPYILYHGKGDSFAAGYLSLYIDA